MKSRTLNPVAAGCSALGIPMWKTSLPCSRSAVSSIGPISVEGSITTDAPVQVRTVQTAELLLNAPEPAKMQE